MDFDTFARSHGGDLARSIALAIAEELTEPTALIVDDVHELSAGALEILVTLAQMTVVRHAVVLALRPEGLVPLRALLAETPFHELTLRVLDRTDLKWALAQTLAGELPDIFNVLYDRTKGHPLFFVGLLNSLVSAGALTRDDYRWRLNKPVDASVELPDTVKRFIEMRLHARGDVPRTVACALALEPAARADDLIAVLGMSEPAVLDAVDDLLALGLIIQPGSGSQFQFAHELVGEVAASGLNVGRRTVLHRAFAERLKTNPTLDTALRQARHFQAAGESLLAAEAFLKSAQEALGLNAAQDALDRCEEGLRETLRLERSRSSEATSARLQRTAARAAMAGGDAADAVRRAREAVMTARASGDAAEYARAMLELAATEGVAHHIEEQRSAATEAAQLARGIDDNALYALALVHQASADREMGLRDEALRACQSARDVADAQGRPEIAQAAREELLRCNLTWWMFSEAFEVARTGLETARRLDPLAEAAFLQVRAALWYLLDCFDEAQSDLRAALQIGNDGISRHRQAFEPLQPLPLLQFMCTYLRGKIALAVEDWDQAVEFVDLAAALTNVAKLPRYGQALALMRINTLLGRNAPSDSQLAHELTVSLNEPAIGQGIVGWSDCVELARACDAARQRAADARAQLRIALNALEENAHRYLLDVDREFARLADAAEEIGASGIANQARGRSKYYRSRRVAAAGSAWGGGKLG
jgi:hypothetical protein